MHLQAKWKYCTSYWKKSLNSSTSAEIVEKQEDHNSSAFCTDMNESFSIKFFD